MINGLTRYGYLAEIEALLDSALSELLAEDFEKLKNDVIELVNDYEN